MSDTNLQNITEALFPAAYINSHIYTQAFGSHWCGPERMPHAQEIKVAEYPKVGEGGGRSVTVFCSAAPARFYQLHVHAGDKEHPAYTIETGAWDGADALVAGMAMAISRGMLGYKPKA